MPGNDGHVWAIRFVEAPAKHVRAKIAKPIAAALTSEIFQQSEETPWRWSKDWLVVGADEQAGAPDEASEERVAALASIEKALRAVHAIAPIAEVLALDFETPSGSEWDAWSRT